MVVAMDPRLAGGKGTFGGRVDDSQAFILPRQEAFDRSTKDLRRAGLCLGKLRERLLRQLPGVTRPSCDVGGFDRFRLEVRVVCLAGKGAMKFGRPAAK